jgi:hypothetical protein
LIITIVTLAEEHSKNERKKKKRQKFIFESLINLAEIKRTNLYKGKNTSNIQTKCIDYKEFIEFLKFSSLALSSVKNPHRFAL